MALSMLDFPQPEGPTMSKELPACRDMLRSRHSCRDLVGVNMLRERRVRPACRRWVRTMREEDAFVSVRAADTTTLCAPKPFDTRDNSSKRKDTTLLWCMHMMMSSVTVSTLHVTRCFFKRSAYCVHGQHKLSCASLGTTQSPFIQNDTEYMLAAV